MLLKRYYLLLSFIVLACNELSISNFQDKECVIRYKEECITKSELKTITQNVSKQDSERIAKKYVNEWLLEQAIFEKVKKEIIKDDREEIENILKKTRKQYYVSYYLRNYVIENLDTTISNNEIIEYYKNHKSDFKLTSNIVQIYYVKLDDNDKIITELKKHLSSTKDKFKLNDFIYEKASSYFIEDSLWLKWDDVTKEIPPLKNYSLSYLAKGKVMEWRNGQNYYYLKIIDYKVKNEFPPIAYEKEKIKKIILEERKKSLIKELKEKVISEIGEQKK